MDPDGKHMEPTLQLKIDALQSRDEDTQDLDEFLGLLAPHRESGKVSADYDQRGLSWFLFNALEDNSCRQVELLLNLGANPFKMHRNMALRSDCKKT